MRAATIFTILSCLHIACSLAQQSQGDDSLQWRGTEGQGHSSATRLPAKWDEHSGIAWKANIPGRGWSSPVIQGPKIWITTAIETAADPTQTQERLKTNTGDQPLTVLDRVEFRAIGIERATGMVVHDLPLFDKEKPQWVHALNSYASPSPVLDHGKLFCHFGANGTACLDTETGKTDWVNNDVEVMHENGPGGSPIVIGDAVVFHMDGSDRQFIVALNRKDGKVLWKTNRSGEMQSNGQMRKSYGTPLAMAIGGRVQIVSPATDWLYGYDPVTGTELWKVPYGELGFSLTPRPVIGNDHIFMATGFGRPQILAIRLENGIPANIAWRYKRGAPTMPSPILIEDKLYFVSDNGIFTCLNATNGEELYRERLGGNFSSSPIFADGKIFVGNREGSVFVISPDEKFNLLAENKLSGAILATPAAVDHALYIRTDQGLYCIEHPAAN
jgi:outer membrane protein assembly factor BamB